MTRKVLEGIGFALIIIFILLMILNVQFKQIVDNHFISDVLYENFVKSEIDGVFIEIDTRSRGGYVMYKDKRGLRQKFLFARKYEPFVMKVNINDSIKKRGNKKEFYIIKPDTTFIVYPNNSEF